MDDAAADTVEHQKRSCQGDEEDQRQRDDPDDAVKVVVHNESRAAPANPKAESESLERRPPQPDSGERNDNQRGARDADDHVAGIAGEHVEVQNEQPSGKRLRRIVLAEDAAAPGIDVHGGRKQAVADLHLIHASIDRPAYQRGFELRISRACRVPCGVPADVAGSRVVQRWMQRTVDVMAIHQRRARHTRNEDDDREHEAQPQMHLQREPAERHGHAKAMRPGYRVQGIAKFTLIVRPRPAM